MGAKRGLKSKLPTPSSPVVRARYVPSDLAGFCWVISCLFAFLSLINGSIDRYFVEITSRFNILFARRYGYQISGRAAAASFVDMAKEKRQVTDPDERERRE